MSALELRGQAVWWPVLWYEGKGRWNLRDDLRQDPSFAHLAQGWGAGTDVQARYRLGPGHLGVGWQWEWMQTRAGTDRVFLADGRTIDSIFNGAQRQGQFYYFTVGLMF